MDGADGEIGQPLSEALLVRLVQQKHRLRLRFPGVRYWTFARIEWCSLMERDIDRQRLKDAAMMLAAVGDLVVMPFRSEGAKPDVWEEWWGRHG